VVPYVVIDATSIDNNVGRMSIGKPDGSAIPGAVLVKLDEFSSIFGEEYALKKRYLSRVKQYVWIVLLCALLATIIGFGVIKIQKPVYQATATMYVVADSPGNSFQTPLSANDSIALATNYSSQILSSSVMDYVYQSDPHLKARGYGPGDLLADVTANPSATSSTFQVIASASNQNDAAMIANDVANGFQAYIQAQTQQQLALMYCAADVTVVPSYHESFGLVAVESLACGTPVVATRAGGLTTIVQHGETGYLVPRCPGFFAEKLDTLLQEPDLLDQMRRAARPSVLDYSWTEVARQVRDLYEDALDESRYLAAQ